MLPPVGEGMSSCKAGERKRRLHRQVLWPVAVMMKTSKRLQSLISTSRKKCLLMMKMKNGRSVDTSAADVEVLSDRVRELTMENERLKSRVSQLMAQPFSEDALAKDEDVRFYTGLPSAAVLKSVFMFMTSGMVPHHGGSKLSPFQEFCIALTKAEAELEVARACFSSWVV